MITIGCANRCRVIWVSICYHAMIGYGTAISESLSCALTLLSSSASFIPQNLERKKVIAETSEKFLKLVFASEIALLLPRIIHTDWLGVVEYCSPKYVHKLLFTNRPHVVRHVQAIKLLQDSMLLQHLNIKGPRFPHPTHVFCMVGIRITCVWMNKNTKGYSECLH